MSQLHGGRIVAKALKNEGVSHIFTLCGGHVMPIYDGCLDVGIASSTRGTSRRRRTRPTAGRASPASPASRS
jgi:hypothetical protein